MDITHDALRADVVADAVNAQDERRPHRVGIPRADEHPAKTKNRDDAVAPDANALAAQRLPFGDQKTLMTPQVWLFLDSSLTRAARNASSVQESCTSSWRRT